MAYAAPISGFASGWPASIEGRCYGLPHASSAQGAKACVLARIGASHHRLGRLLHRKTPLLMQDSGGGGQQEGNIGISLSGRAIALSKEDTAEGKKLQEILSRCVHASPCLRISVSPCLCISVSPCLSPPPSVCIFARQFRYVWCQIIVFFAIKKPRNAKRHTQQKFSRS